ncbi:HEPN domain-containing protein [Candidatus Peregrinibacteria bacterium]|nr:HEPN domain-containing protein [Candidatus Peregrinibacteria bacterium]
MSEKEIIDHWKKGAQEAIGAARVLCEKGFYESALFHCHLAIEKALKALYMEQHGEDHPFSHDLAHLAELLEHHLAGNDMSALQELSEFVVDARYSDPYWAAEQATADNARRWIQTTEHLLASLLDNAS